MLGPTPENGLGQRRPHQPDRRERSNNLNGSFPNSNQLGYLSMWRYLIRAGPTSRRESRICAWCLLAMSQQSAIRMQTNGVKRISRHYATLDGLTTPQPGTFVVW